MEFNFEPQTTRHFIQLHEIGQSPYNFEVDQGNIQWIGYEPGKSYLLREMRGLTYLLVLKD